MVSYMSLVRQWRWTRHPSKWDGNSDREARCIRGWLWPIYSESDEICFTYLSSRGKLHIEDQLEGVLLTDGYVAYDAHSAPKIKAE